MRTTDTEVWPVTQRQKMAGPNPHYLCPGEAWCQQWWSAGWTRRVWGRSEDEKWNFSCMKWLLADYVTSRLFFMYIVDHQVLPGGCCCIPLTTVCVWFCVCLRVCMCTCVYVYVSVCVFVSLWLSNSLSDCFLARPVTLTFSYCNHLRHLDEKSVFLSWPADYREKNSFLFLSHLSNSSKYLLSDQSNRSLWTIFSITLKETWKDNYLW